ncbi:MAG: hypothetical protein ABW171_16540 [Steroidobacter sp.]
MAMLALLLHAAAGWASQLTPSMDAGQLSVLVESTTLPEALRKDLTSGLTNRILIRVTLASGAKTVQQRAVEIAVRYDLWDEHFAVRVALDGAEAEARTLKTLDEMQALLRALRLPRLFATTGMNATQPHNVTAEILLNPIDRERMEMIRKWVAESSIAPADIRGRNTSDLSLVIFNRIFEQYAKGADIAAIWRETLTSPPFTFDKLPDDSP